MSDGAAVHSKWDGNGCAGMARCLLPAMLTRSPIPPPHYYDGCNANFNICHALDCKWGGLVMALHNKLRDEVADLEGKAFTPSHVSDDLLIFSGCAMKRSKENPSRIKGTTVLDVMPPIGAMEQKGDLLIRDLWQNGTDSLHDMRIVNIDAKSYSAKTLEECLQEAEWAKKKM